jgi:hypothetical protein
MLVKPYIFRCYKALTRLGEMSLNSTGERFSL